MLHLPRSTNGFTLIELMITVAIIAILGAIAYPSYTRQVIASRRTDAQRVMVSHAQSMERYFTGNSRYTTASGNKTCGPENPTATSAYTFATSCEDATFTITAKATGSQTGDGNLTLDQTGARTPTDKWRN